MVFKNQMRFVSFQSYHCFHRYKTMKICIKGVKRLEILRLALEIVFLDIVIKFYKTFYNIQNVLGSK